MFGFGMLIWTVILGVIVWSVVQASSRNAQGGRHTPGSRQSSIPADGRAERGRAA